MSHLKMDFANEAIAAGVAANASRFTLRCVNNSASNWVFYVYQRMPGQPYDIYSLAWLASPYALYPGSMMTFTWTLDTSFVWGSTGMLTPGVAFMTSGMQPCDANSRNMTIFNMNNNMPSFSPPTNDGRPGALSIMTAANIPSRVFSTGIGMSGQAVFAQQAMANVHQEFNASAPQYWIAASRQMQAGAVLSGDGGIAAPFNFQGTDSMTATLNMDNTWTINR